MDTTAVKIFDEALLELDAALRPLVSRPNLTERLQAIREAHQRFVAAVAPYRMQIAIADAMAAAGALGNPFARGRALDLLARSLELAQDAGVPRSEIVALVNQETVEHARA